MAERLRTAGVFIDTSAILAVVVANDSQHARAVAWLEEAFSGELHLFTSTAILLETTALLQTRHGLAAASRVHDDLFPAFDLVGIDAELLGRAVARWRAARRRALSLVDCTSFEIMSGLGARRAFAYDRHFATEGFELIG